MAKVHIRCHKFHYGLAILTEYQNKMDRLIVRHMHCAVKIAVLLHASCVFDFLDVLVLALSYTELLNFISRIVSTDFTKILVLHSF